MHPWVWLNEPQHSAAVQAVTSMIAAGAAIVAGIYAVRAYSAAKSQAEYARVQAAEAHEQTQLARDEAAAEKEISGLNLRIMKAQVREQFRPLLNIKFDVATDEFDVPEAFYQLSNDGSGPAKNIAIRPMKTTENGIEYGPLTRLAYPVLPGRVTNLYRAKVDFGDFFVMFFESATGDRFASICHADIDGNIWVSNWIDDPPDWPED